MAEVQPKSNRRASLLPFAVRTVWTPACARLMLIGELDLSGVETVGSCVDALLSVRPLPGRVIVDLHELRFADVVGIRTLIKACGQLRRMVPVDVCGIQPAVQRVLDLASASLSGGPHSQEGALTGTGPP